MTFNSNPNEYFQNLTAIGSPGQTTRGYAQNVAADGLSGVGDFQPPSEIPPPSIDGPGFGINTLKDADGVVTQQGLLSPALGIAGAGFNIYQGLKQLGIQEDTLDFTKDSFNKNFAASKAAFQERLRGNYGRKATLGGNKGETEQAYVDKRSDF